MTEIVVGVGIVVLVVVVLGLAGGGSAGRGWDAPPPRTRSRIGGGWAGTTPVENIKPPSHLGPAPGARRPSDPSPDAADLRRRVEALERLHQMGPR